MLRMYGPALRLPCGMDFSAGSKVIRNNCANEGVPGDEARRRARARLHTMASSGSSVLRVVAKPSKHKKILIMGIYIKGYWSILRDSGIVFSYHI